MKHNVNSELSLNSMIGKYCDDVSDDKTFEEKINEIKKIKNDKIEKKIRADNLLLNKCITLMKSAAINGLDQVTISPEQYYSELHSPTIEELNRICEFVKSKLINKFNVEIKDNNLIIDL